MLEGTGVHHDSEEKDTPCLSHTADGQFFFSVQPCALPTMVHMADTVCLTSDFKRLASPNIPWEVNSNVCTLYPMPMSKFSRYPVSVGNSN